jgi:uncharacterized protein (TIGR03437 family)
MLQRLYLGFVLGTGIVSILTAQEIKNIAVSSAAGYHSGLPSRGSIATIFCTGIGIQGTVAATGYPLPQELAGVKVTVAGATARIIAVADLGGFQQINFQVPFEADYPQAEADVEVQQGLRVGAARTRVRTESPGEFFILPGNTAAMQHSADYSLVGWDRPARPGEILIAYLTGMPEVQLQPATGDAAPVTPLAIVPEYLFTHAGEAYWIKIDDTVVKPLFIGLTPGLAGVFQINFQLPETTLPGVRQVLLHRASCRALFGSCQGGGGFKTNYDSISVALPVAPR